MTNNITIDPKVLMPLIRRATPTLIANQITGVQLMPDLDKDYKVYLNSENYKYFLRVNNRRREFSIDELKQAGYTVATIESSNDRIWCEENLPRGSYVLSTRWFLPVQVVFSNENDLVMYQLACGR